MVTWLCGGRAHSSSVLWVKLSISQQGRERDRKMLGGHLSLQGQDSQDPVSFHWTPPLKGSITLPRLTAKSLGHGHLYDTAEPRSPAQEVAEHCLAI